MLYTAAYMFSKYHKREINMKLCRHELKNTRFTKKVIPTNSFAKSWKVHVALAGNWDLRVRD